MTGKRIVLPVLPVTDKRIMLPVTDKRIMLPVTDKRIMLPVTDKKNRATRPTERIRGTTPPHQTKVSKLHRKTRVAVSRPELGKTWCGCALAIEKKNQKTINHSSASNSPAYPYVGTYVENSRCRSKKDKKRKKKVAEEKAGYNLFAPTAHLPRSFVYGSVHYK